MSSHLLGNIRELCDSVLFIADGRIATSDGEDVVEMYDALYC